MQAVPLNVASSVSLSQMMLEISLTVLETCTQGPYIFPLLDACLKKIDKWLHKYADPQLGVDLCHAVLAVHLNRNEQYSSQMSLHALYCLQRATDYDAEWVNSFVHEVLQEHPTVKLPARRAVRQHALKAPALEARQSPQHVRASSLSRRSARSTSVDSDRHAAKRPRVTGSSRDVSACAIRQDASIEHQTHRDTQSNLSSQMSSC